mmetsp:Transcript_119649/g.217395  ORF Transcript_119649/g.217395 Transcript_119649/m.217395 type:complete len:430 (+) Transcript_119649:80-1369(+)
MATSAWNQLPKGIDNILAGIRGTKCDNVMPQCLLSCSYNGDPCRGHFCGGTCNVDEKNILETLIHICDAEMRQDSDLSSNKFFLEKVVLKRLRAVQNAFEIKCTSMKYCCSRCLGCAGHRDCYNGDHAYNCSLSRASRYHKCGRNHVCNSTSSPNLKFVSELEDLKADVVALLQKPFGPDATDLQLAVGPDDSVSQVAKRKAELCDLETGNTKKLRGDIPSANVEEDKEKDSLNSFTHTIVSESCVSADGGPHCFLADMLFCVQAEPPRFVSARDLSRGSLVVAADAKTSLQVISIKEDETLKVIELHAEDAAPFKTTASHRVMVPAYGTKPIAIRAGDIKEGAFVLCTANIAKKVIQVKTLDEKASIVAISFMPDEPVAAFMPPSSMILTKGLTFKPTRRGGMHKKLSKSIEPDCDLMSLKTEGEYED